MQLYNVTTQTEIGIDLPKVVNEKHQTNEVSKSFPDNSDGRGIGMPLSPAQSRKPELQSNGPRSFDYRTVSFGQATV